MKQSNVYGKLRIAALWGPASVQVQCSRRCSSTTQLTGTKGRVLTWQPRHATTCHDIPSKLTCPSSRDAVKQQLQIISSKDKTQREKACDRHLNRTGHLVARQGLLRVQGGTSLERETGQPAILLSLFSPGSLYQACPWCRGMFKLICVQYVQSRHQTSPDSNGAWICGAIEQRICTQVFYGSFTIRTPSGLHLGAYCPLVQRREVTRNDL